MAFHSSHFEFDDDETKLVVDSFSEDEDDEDIMHGVSKQHIRVAAAIDSAGVVAFGPSPLHEKKSSFEFLRESIDSAKSWFAGKKSTEFTPVPLKEKELIVNERTSSIRPEFQMKSMIPTLFILAIANLVLPIVIYFITTRVLQGSQLLGLILSAIPPMMESLYTIITRSRIDALSGIVVTSIVLNIILLVSTQSVIMGLLKESVVTGLFGFVFLISTMYPRPWISLLRGIFRIFRVPLNTIPPGTSKNLIYYLLRDTHPTHFSSHWDINESFKSTTLLLSKIWGCTLLLEASIRVGLAFYLIESVELFLMLSFILFGVTLLGLCTVSGWLLKRIGVWSDVRDDLEMNEDGDGRRKVKERLKQVTLKVKGREKVSVEDEERLL